ncbi:MAG: ATP-binding protein [bacterium]|nr:ATP-binding protein [bacterium]
MRMAGELAAKMGFSPERIQDLETAVAEACINAMEHGNQFDVSTKIYVSMTVHDDKLAIDVVDEGRSGPPPAEISAPNLDAQFSGLAEPGGMGLFVIKALVDEADFVAPDLGTGNQFRMVIHLQQPGEHSA